MLLTSGGFGMPVCVLPEVQVEQDTRIVLLRFTGVLNLETFIVGREALQTEGGWSPSYAHIFDFTAVTDIDLSPSAIEQLAAAAPVFDRSAPQILVTREGSFEFILASTFQSLARGRRIVQLASSVDEARRLIEAMRRGS